MQVIIGERHSGRRKGIAIGTALLVSAIGGGVWSSITPNSSAPQSAKCMVLAGRAGQLPCHNKYENTPDSRAVRRIVGSTVTGCVMGLIFVGPEAVPGTCVGGLVGNIPWADMH